MHHLFARHDRSALLPLTAMVALAATTNLAQAETLFVASSAQEFLSIDTTTGVVTDLVDTPENVFRPDARHIEIADDGMIYVTHGSDLYTFTPGSPSPYAFVMNMGVDMSTLSSAPGGQLIGTTLATVGGDVFQINPNNSQMTSLKQDGMKYILDPVVDANGNVFSNTVSHGFGYMPASGGDFVQIGNFDTSDVVQLDIGTDGLLYASSNSERSFLKIDPVTGDSVMIASNAYESVLDMTVGDDNTLYFAGTVDGIDGVFRLNGDTPELIVGNDTVDFFKPRSLALNTGFRATAIPEPSALALAALASLGFIRRRRSA